MWFPAVGGDPSWTNTEESVIVPGLGPADARDLGRDLGQDAVFVWDADGWSVHSCTHDRRVTLGWAIKPAPAEVVDLAVAVTRLGLPSEYVTLIEASTALDRALSEAPQDADALERAHSLVAQEFWRRSDRLARLSREREAAAEAPRFAPQRELARQAKAARSELARPSTRREEAAMTQEDTSDESEVMTQENSLPGARTDCDRRVFNFDNGYRVEAREVAYEDEEGLYEVFVHDPDGNITYDVFDPDDDPGCLFENEVQNLLNQIEALPPQDARRVFKFDNGYSASVVRDQETYGDPYGLYELTVIGPDGEPDYDTFGLDDEAFEGLYEEEVQAILNQIEGHPGQEEQT